MTALFSTISLEALPPETWVALASIALTLVVSAAHARGRRLPLLEWLLDVIHAKPSAPPPTAVSSEGLLRDLLHELRARRKTAPKDKSGAD